VALDPIPQQNAVDSEPVQPRFLNHDDRIALSGPRQSLPPQYGKASRKPSMSPASTACLDILSPPPGEREGTIQIDRLSSTCVRIAAVFCVLFK
jgi:hypothetical protein